MFYFFLKRQKYAQIIRILAALSFKIVIVNGLLIAYYYLRLCFVPQSDLLLPAADYYKLGFEHPILQTYYKLLVDTAKLLGADTQRYVQ